MMMIVQVNPGESAYQILQLFCGKCYDTEVTFTRNGLRVRYEV